MTVTGGIAKVKLGQLTGDPLLPSRSMLPLLSGLAALTTPACTPSATISHADAPAEAPPPALAQATASPLPQESPSPSPPPTPTLGWARPVVDLHVDTHSRIKLEGLHLDNDPALEASLDDLDAAGVGLIVEAVWVPAAHRAPDPHRWAVEGVKALRASIDERPERWTLVEGPADLADLGRSGQLGALMAIEGGHALRSADDVALFAQLGVRMIGLTWSFSNPLCGSSGDRPAPGQGLTALGRAVVVEMNRLGVAIDVSHASDACIDDVLALSEAPVLASHSNARAVRDVPRNLTDDHLGRIAEGGGLVGVMFHGPFVASEASRADVLSHILHMGSVMGLEHVALGSDFDGWIKKPAGLSDARDLPLIAPDLATAGLSEDEIRGVMGLNARHYFMRLWEMMPPFGGATGGG